MVVKSHGKHKRTREKLRKTRKVTVNQYLRKFNVGDSVAIRVESAEAISMPHRRFFGITGKITGTRGRAYIVQIKDSGKLKTVIAKPEHIKVVK